MVLARDNCDYGIFWTQGLRTAKPLFNLCVCIIMKRFWKLVIRVRSYGASQVFVIWGDTGQSIPEKKNFFLYWCNRCSTGRSCSKADQRLSLFFFCSKTLLWVILLLFLRASDHQPDDKMKLSHLISNFALTLLAWVILIQRWTTRAKYCSKQLTKF